MCLHEIFAVKMCKSERKTLHSPFREKQILPRNGMFSNVFVSNLCYNIVTLHSPFYPEMVTFTSDLPRNGGIPSIQASSLESSTTSTRIFKAFPPRADVGCPFLFTSNSCWAVYSSTATMCHFERSTALPPTHQLPFTLAFFPTSFSQLEAAAENMCRKFCWAAGVDSGRRPPDAAEAAEAEAPDEAAPADPRAHILSSPPCVKLTPSVIKNSGFGRKG